jgi:hypothetical protein
VVALFFSIFVCSSIFYAVNAKSAAKDAEKTIIASSAPTGGNQHLASLTH